MDPRPAGCGNPPEDNSSGATAPDPIQPQRGGPIGQGSDRRAPRLLAEAPQRPRPPSQAFLRSIDCRPGSSQGSGGRPRALSCAAGGGNAVGKALPLPRGLQSVESSYGKHQNGRHGGCRGAPTGQHLRLRCVPGRSTIAKTAALTALSRQALLTQNWPEVDASCVRSHRTRDFRFFGPAQTQIGQKTPFPGDRPNQSILQVRISCAGRLVRHFLNADVVSRQAFKLNTCRDTTSAFKKCLTRRPAQLIRAWRIDWFGLSPGKGVFWPICVCAGPKNLKSHSTKRATSTRTVPVESTLHPLAQGGPSCLGSAGEIMSGPRKHTIVRRGTGWLWTTCVRTGPGVQATNSRCHFAVDPGGLPSTCDEAWEPPYPPTGRQRSAVLCRKTRPAESDQRRLLGTINANKRRVRPA